MHLVAWDYEVGGAPGVVSLDMVGTVGSAAGMSPRCHFGWVVAYSLDQGSRRPVVHIGFRKLYHDHFAEGSLYQHPLPFHDYSYHCAVSAMIRVEDDSLACQASASLERGSRSESVPK